jgi:hypothetical protein|tara:strand:+ start:951 stop:1331 length:381 start_codon:yes stop_codon:yes gene_type:complete
MAHFAKLDNNNIVTLVVTVNNDIATDEAAGISFLKTLYKESNSIWKQTSYNTIDGIHKLGGTPFRKNYAGIGYTYDEARNAFIPTKLYPSWTLNEDTCRWTAPIVKPDDGKRYNWNEDNQSWDLSE